MNGELPFWELFQMIPYQGEHPQNVFIQNGWEEYSHKHILKKKDEIFYLEKSNEWGLRKKITNPYEAIFSTSDTKTFPSIALISPLSRSYFKMVEMLHVCDFWNLVSKNTPFKSAHICEGPGGFLQCVVEEGKRRKLLFGAAYAMTLKSTKSQIPGWKRSSRFLKKHPEIQLLYGADMTGNILVKRNQDFFCETVKSVNIFTADGGFDFSTDYSKQEETSFLLVLASFYIGLRCVQKGGVLIIKLFDIYSPIMLDLIIGTASYCKSFVIYKPATSRPCNSERYFIGQGYSGIEESLAWIKHLEKAQVKHVEKPLTRLCEIDPESPYIVAIKEQIEWQEELQLNNIETAINMTKNDIEYHIRNTIEKSIEWCEAFSVPYSL